MKLRAFAYLAACLLPIAAVAEPYGPPVVSDPIYGEISPFKGFYAGFGVSTAWLKTTQSPYASYSPAYPVSYTASGNAALGPAVQMGYNWSSGPILYGADLNAAWVNHTATAANATNHFFSGAYGLYINGVCPGYCGGSMRATYAVDFLPRIGYTLAGGVTPYLVGGFGYHQVAFGAPALGQNGSSQWYPTWTIGAGIEIPVTGHVSVKTQYLFNQTFIRNIEDQSLNFSGVYHF